MLAFCWGLKRAISLMGLLGTDYCTSVLLEEKEDEDIEWIE